ncbi:condensation domain-containing protein [Actinomadura sp. 9N215]|uniref:condensation domain-containing protein n=1 Tax=Actinomadura sp. 9N215 TaxID=3375150 RepID=UPI0037956DAE
MTRDQAMESRIERERALLSRRRARTGAIPALPRTGDTHSFPASYLQEAMWVQAQAEGEPDPLVVAGLRLHGPLDVEVLSRSLAALTGRHETLRTMFRMRDGHLRQIVEQPRPCAIPVERITLDQFEQVTWREVDRPFDLESEPAYRLRLLRLAEDDHIAMLLLHHIIGDARAVEVFIRDLAAYYMAFRGGTRPELPRLPVQYGDFAAWHRARLDGRHGAEQLDYWVARLSGAVPAWLPADLRPPGRSFDGTADGFRSRPGHTLIVPVAPELFAGVEDLARRHRTTLYIVSCVAFQVLLARYSGERDIAVRAPISFRNWREVEDLIADFGNDIVFRTDLSGDPSFAELFARVREPATRDFACNELPPSLLEPELGNDPALLGRLFHVQFTAETDPDLSIPLGDLRVEPMPPPWQYAFRPLALRLRKSASGPVCIATYRTAVFSRQRADDLVHDYIDVLAELVADPDRRVFAPPVRQRIPARIPA